MVSSEPALCIISIKLRVTIIISVTRYSSGSGSREAKIQQMPLPRARCKPVEHNLQGRQKLAVLNPSPTLWAGFKGLEVVEVEGKISEESS